MDLAAILKVAGPQLVGFLRNYASNNFKEDELEPAPTDDPSAAIRNLQGFLNRALDLNPPLEEDGWLGPKTEAAIDEGIRKLEAYGIGRD